MPMLVGPSGPTKNQKLNDTVAQEIEDMAMGSDYTFSSDEPEPEVPDKATDNDMVICNGPRDGEAVDNNER